MNYFRAIPVALLATWAFGADPEEPITPVLLHTNDAPAFIPAIRISLSGDKERDIGQSSRTAKYGFNFKSTLSTKPETNTETTNLDLYAGLVWRLNKAGRNTLSNEPEPNLNNPNAKEPVVSRSLHPGYVFINLSAAYESDQKFENTQSAAGLRLNYEPDPEGPDYQWVLPHAWLEYRYIHQFGSKLASELGIAEQNYWRLGTGISWDIPFTPRTVDAKPKWKFAITPSLGYYRNTDLLAALKNAGLTEALNYSLTVRYDLLGNGGIRNYLRYISVGVAHGHVPPKIIDETTYSLSIGVRWGGEK